MLRSARAADRTKPGHCLFSPSTIFLVPYSTLFMKPWLPIVVLRQVVCVSCSVVSARSARHSRFHWVQHFLPLDPCRISQHINLEVRPTSCYDNAFLAISHIFPLMSRHHYKLLRSSSLTVSTPPSISSHMPLGLWQPDSSTR